MQDETTKQTEEAVVQNGNMQKEVAVTKPEEKSLRPGEEKICFTKATEDRMARIEMLLITQAEHNKKMLRASRVRTIGMLVFVVVFAVSAFAFYNIVSDITIGFPRLIDATNQLVEMATTDLDDVVAKVNEIDFNAINGMVRGVGSIDFGGINSSINGLKEGVAAFQQFASALAKPANALGSLFG